MATKRIGRARFQAKSKAWLKEYKKQRKEHPSMPPWAIKRIASDHIKRGGR